MRGFFPDDLDKIKRIIQEEKMTQGYLSKLTQLPRVLLDKKFSTLMSSLDPPKSSMTVSDSDYSLCNSYSIINSFVQCNEAINKLICISEIIYSYAPNNDDDKLIKSYEGKYSGGTVLPTLYYSLLSAIMSTMSMRGCIFYRQENTPYNVIRKGKRWDKKNRKNFIYKLTGKKIQGDGHELIFQIFKAFKEKYGLFEKITVSDYQEILSNRNNAHYNILGSLTQTNAVAPGKFFWTFPHVYNVINKNLSDLSFVWDNQLPYMTGITRFRELSKKKEELFHSNKYGHYLGKMDEFNL